MLGVVSNVLTLTSIPKDIKERLRVYCKYDISAFAGEDGGYALDLYKEIDNDTVQVPRGLLPYLQIYCTRNNIPIKIEFDTAPAVDYCFKINPKVKYTEGVYGYQGRAVQELLSHHTVRLRAPTGSGKTVMACLFAAILNKGPILILANRQRLLNQFYIALSHVLGFSREEIGIIKAEKRVIRPITLGSLQTLGGKNFDISSIKHEFHVVIFDECHLSTAVTYRNVVLGLAPRHLIGLSATPEHYVSQDLNSLMTSMFGPIGVVIEEHEIPGRLTPTTISRYTNMSFPYKAGKKSPSYIRYKCQHLLFDKIASSDKRNKLITRDTQILVKKKHKVLITTTRVIHAKLLYDLLVDKGIKCSFPYTYKVTKSGKESVKVNHKQLDLDVEQILEGNIDVLIGTYGLFQLGFDCSALSAIQFAAPFSGWNSTALKQAVGRVLRRYFNKDSAVVVDYVDDSYPVNVLNNWFEGRTNTLIKEFNNHIEYGKD